jgi:hypothetical protein
MKKPLRDGAAVYAKVHLIVYAIAYAKVHLKMVLVLK